MEVRLDEEGRKRAKGTRRKEEANWGDYGCARLAKRRQEFE